MSVFDDIYGKNGWGFGSGHGSLPRVTKGYRKFLEDFLLENGINNVVDYGCGDWQFSSLVNWHDAKYTGFDLVESLVEKNNTRYGSAMVEFKVAPNSFSKLPRADLLIVKDVLQHWPTKDVQKFLTAVAPKYKYMLLTNCIEPRDELNIDIKLGGFRPLDLRKKPFGLTGAAVYTFSGPKVFSVKSRSFFPAWRKTVLLVCKY